MLYFWQVMVKYNHQSLLPLYHWLAVVGVWQFQWVWVLLQPVPQLSIPWSRFWRSWGGPLLRWPHLSKIFVSLSHRMELLLYFRIWWTYSDVWPQPLGKSGIGHFPLSFIVWTAGSSWDLIRVAHFWRWFVVLGVAPLSKFQTTRCWWHLFSVPIFF